MFTPRAGNLVPPGPALESGTGELGHTPLWGEMQKPLHEVTQTRRMARKVGDPGNHGSKLRPAVNHTERVGVQGPHPAFIIVRINSAL